MASRTRTNLPKAIASSQILARRGQTLEEVWLLLGPAWTIEGEDEETYKRLLVQVGDAIGPRGIVDWLLIKDVVALTWEIQRSRRLSKSLIRLHQREAMETILRQLMQKPDSPSIKHAPAVLAAQWAEGQRSAEDEIDALFKKAGYSMAEVDAQVLTKHAEEFDRIDARTESCEQRRDKLLQQIDRRRAGAAKAVLEASEEVTDADFVSSPPERAKANSEGGS